jgi:CHAD domain-containing protein
LIDPTRPAAPTAEAIHRVRTEARRLDSTLRAYGARAPALLRAQGPRLRRFRRLLGAIRDTDEVTLLVARFAATLPPGEARRLAPLRAALRRDRARELRVLRAWLRGTEGRRLARALAAVTELPPSGSATPVLRRRLRHLRKSVREVRTRPTDARLHHLRRRLRRVCDVLGDLAPRAPREVHRCLAALQSLRADLGALQDARVALVRLERLVRAVPAPRAAFLAGRLAEQQALRYEALRCSVAVTLGNWDERPCRQALRAVQ